MSVLSLSKLFNTVKEKSGLWLITVRAKFLTASILPVILGTAVAHWHTELFNFSLFILSIIGVVLLHSGANILNDYYDFKSGADVLNENPTQFSGGSGVLVNGLLKEKTVKNIGLLSIILGTSTGFYLALNTGYFVFIIGMIGMLLGVFYTAPPLKLAYRGFGEVIVGFVFGPLIVLGSYYVQVGTLSTIPVVAGIPLGFLIAGVLYINQFPDYKPDKLAGKNNLVVKLGPKKAVKGYTLIIASAYLSVLLGFLFFLIPSYAIIALGTLPLSYKSKGILGLNFINTKKLLPANALAIQTHLITGLLLSLGYLIPVL